MAEGIDPFGDSQAAPTNAEGTAVPNLEKIYHICQASKWVAAVSNGVPYYPPTFVADGRFTRASQEKCSIVDTANHYYRGTPGKWICLELDAPKLLELGLQILPQCAPEGTADKPINCLQIFGGITTTIPGVVVAILPMIRLKDGFFHSLGEPSTELAIMYSPPSRTPVECASGACKTESSERKTKEVKRRGLFGRKGKT